jgi:VWFA-related protein
MHSTNRICDGRGDRPPRRAGCYNTASSEGASQRPAATVPHGGCVLKSVLSLTMLATAVVVAGVSAQEQPTADDRPEVIGGLAFIDEVKLTVVNIDVFVTDNGKAVTDLEADDFRVLQDGQERQLSHFALYTEEVISRIVQNEADASSAVPPPTPEAAVAEPATTARPEIKPVYIVLFIDNENLRPMDRNRVLGQIQAFLNEVMYPHVQVMVVTYQRSLKVEQPFTNNSKEISDALRAVRSMNATRGTQDTERKKILREFSALQQGGSRGTQQDRIELEGMIRSYADVIDNELDFAINAVREITATLSGLPGRKYLFHISSGLPMVPAKDLLYQLGTTFQQTSTLAMESRLNRRRQYQNLASAANSQGVTFYTIDASGMGGAGDSISAEYAGATDPITAGLYVINHQEPLQYIAEKTGGRAILSVNDVTSGLEQFRQDLFSYYSLGYTISGSGTDTIHRLEVQLPDHPGYELNYRRNFVEKSLESKIQDRVLSGLTFDIEENPMAVSVDTGAATPAAGERSILPVEIGFPLDSIALVPDGDEYVGQVVVFVAVRDDKGRQSDMQRRDHEIRIPRNDLEAHHGDRYVIELPLLMRPGSVRIVVAVMDRLTRQASYSTIHRTVPSAG